MGPLGYHVGVTTTAQNAFPRPDQVVRLTTHFGISESLCKVAWVHNKLQSFENTALQDISALAVWCEFQAFSKHLSNAHEFSPEMCDWTKWCSEDRRVLPFLRLPLYFMSRCRCQPFVTYKPWPTSFFWLWLLWSECVAIWFVVCLFVCSFVCMFVIVVRTFALVFIMVPVLLCFYGIGGGFASCFLRTCLLGPMLSILLYGDPITVASCVGVSWPDAQDRDSCRVGSAVPLALIKNWRKCKFKAVLKPTTQGKFGMLEFNFCLLQLGPDHCTTCL